MKYNKKGESVQIGSRQFIIGSKVYGNHSTGYEDWEGTLIEVRTDSDIQDKKEHKLGEVVVDFGNEHIYNLGTGETMPVSFTHMVLSIFSVEPLT